MGDNIFLSLCLNGEYTCDTYLYKEDDHMKRVIWDEEEAALLVDTYRRIEATPLQKNELLHQLSDVLRKKSRFERAGNR